MLFNEYQKLALRTAGKLESFEDKIIRFFSI